MYTRLVQKISVSVARPTCFWEKSGAIFGHWRQLRMRSALVSHLVQMTKLCVECWKSPKYIEILVTRLSQQRDPRTSVQSVYMCSISCCDLIWNVLGFKQPDSNNWLLVFWLGDLKQTHLLDRPYTVYSSSTRETCRNILVLLLNMLMTTLQLVYAAF